MRQSAEPLDSLTTQEELEEAFFFGAPPDLMFAYRHRAATPRRGSFVVCPPFGAEFEQMYRTQVLLARALAAAGFDVIRFHYRGAGQSFGEPAELTLSGMADDAISAAQLRQGTGPLFFLGIRLGGLVAAMAARQWHGAPVALVEPVTEPSRYFRELRRWRLLRGLKQGEVSAESTKRSMAVELDTQNWIDILGYTVHAATIRSSEGVTLGKELAGGRGPVLLVQVSPAPQLSAEFEKLVAECRASGTVMRTSFIRYEVAWWLQGAHWEPAKDRQRSRGLAETVNAWAKHISNEL